MVYNTEVFSIKSKVNRFFIFNNIIHFFIFKPDRYQKYVATGHTLNSLLNYHINHKKI